MVPCPLTFIGRQEGIDYEQLLSTLRETRPQVKEMDSLVEIYVGGMTSSRMKYCVNSVRIRVHNHPLNSFKDSVNPQNCIYGIRNNVFPSVKCRNQIS